MKGVAILLMIFLHLFNQTGNVALCKNFIFIDGTPLVLILSRASNPVAFFLILGGYGLYKVYRKGDKNRWTRLLKLMIHYWVILAIFLTIGHFMYPDRYPGSWMSLINNVTSFNTTYNGEMWFLLPYVILSAMSPWLFRIMDRFKAIYVICFTLFIHICTSFCISRYGEVFFYHNYWAYNPLLVFHLLFNFCLGAICARTLFFERVSNLCNKHNISRLFAWVGVIVLIIISCIFKYNFFYALGVITCLSVAPIPILFKQSLCKLGDNSMNMWMIHSWFCYYLFHNLIYSFTYPLLIFIVLVIISYLSSIIINKITVPIEKLIMPQKAIKAKPIL